jgi:cytochrome c oxidase assembly factor CtaG
MERLAHVQAGAELPPLDPGRALTTWAFDPLAWAGLALALILYLAAVRRVDAAHPASPVPRRRVAAWIAGLLVAAIALQSSIDVYATRLFSVHMVQHMLLTLVAAPLLALGAPVTLLLRVAGPGRWRRLTLAILHSRPVRVISHPVVAWLLFTAVMWISHFSPLFDAALEDEGIHAAEHLLYLAAGMLFWWPVVAADPVPWRMGFAARVVYVGLAMPQNTFLGLAVFSATRPLYHHYATIERAWGPDVMADQQLAGGLMWAAGDLLFFVPLLLLVAAWLQDEERRGRHLDEQLDREREAQERARIG